MFDMINISEIEEKKIFEIQMKNSNSEIMEFQISLFFLINAI